MRADMGVRSASGTKADPSLVIFGMFRERAFFEIRAWIESPALVAEVVVRKLLRHRLIPS